MTSNDKKSGPNILIKLKERDLLEKKLKIKQGLPHLYGFKWYPWAWDFFTSTNKNKWLVSANQISKSSTQIRTDIEWATNPKLWPKLWDTEPRSFFYLYPSMQVAKVEIMKKWIPEFLPRNEFIDHPRFGWKLERDKGDISAIHFNTGVSIFIHSYGKDAKNLQTATVHKISCDEEIPFHLYDELSFRRSAVDGYWSCVFTATIGQEELREIIEVKGERERFPEHWKRQISMYDCQYYIDGTPSRWTDEKIEQIKKMCSTEKEVLRRVYGRFVSDSGLLYPSFTDANIKPPLKKIPPGWHFYAGVDLGSGGTGRGHPSAITHLAVNQNFTYGRIFKGWRGDGVITTAADVVKKHMQLRGARRYDGQWYDYASKEFFNIASRMGEPFEPADKGKEYGEYVLNLLFKAGMLDIDDTPELRPLIYELRSIKKDQPKNDRRDDFADSTRYVAVKIPWNYEKILDDIDPSKALSVEKPPTIDEMRRNDVLEMLKTDNDSSWTSPEEEFDFFNDLNYDAYYD